MNFFTSLLHYFSLCDFISSLSLFRSWLVPRARHVRGREEGQVAGERRGREALLLRGEERRLLRGGKWARKGWGKVGEGCSTSSIRLRRKWSAEIFSLWGGEVFIASFEYKYKTMHTQKIRKMN